MKKNSKYLNSILLFIYLKKLSIQNALRYFPTDLHEILAIDFANVIFL